MRRLILHDTNGEFVKLGTLLYKFSSNTNCLEVRHMDEYYKRAFNDGDYIYIDFSQDLHPIGLVMSPNDICKFTMWAMGVPSERRHIELSSYIKERLTIPNTIPMIQPSEELDYAASMAVNDAGKITVLSMLIRGEYIKTLSEDDRNRAISKVMINYPKGYNLVPIEYLKDKLKNTFNFSDELLSDIEMHWVSE